MIADTVLRLVKTVEMPGIATYEQFVVWLKFLHGTMLASEPLLEIAAQKSDGALRDYFRAHLEEERGHAAWLADDLRVIGEEPSKIDHAAAATAGAQYYYLQHIGPHPLLGYMAAMEFRPMSLTDLEAFEKTFGAPALRTIRHHATHDVEHAKTLAHMIDRCEQFADLICYSAFVTTKMFAFYLTDRFKPLEVRHA